MSAFSKRHYEAVAQMIRSLVAITDADREKVARQFAATFQAQHTAFKPHLFVAACGFEYISDAIHEQDQIAIAATKEHDRLPTYETWNAQDAANRKLNSMVEGRWATREEVALIDGGPEALRSTIIDEYLRTTSHAEREYRAANAQGTPVGSAPR